uniref:UBA_6 domain-containing protein n=1 Tax=Gongylonema pulchrum TaxID=637853 RepID=A0A183DI04_9BILA
LGFRSKTKACEMLVAAESRDSCYSSCSEESHSSLSRESSDDVAKEIEKLHVRNTDSKVSPASAAVIESTTLKYTSFATRLGYSVKQLQTVVEKLGASAVEDQILSELIKLGNGASDDEHSNEADGTPPETPVLSPFRSIVIDGSNIAMTFVSILSFFNFWQ